MEALLSRTLPSDPTRFTPVHQIAAAVLDVIRSDPHFAKTLAKDLAATSLAGDDFLRKTAVAAHSLPGTAKYEVIVNLHSGETYGIDCLPFDDIHGVAGVEGLVGEDAGLKTTVLEYYAALPDELNDVSKCPFKAIRISDNLWMDIRFVESQVRTDVRFLHVIPGI